MDGSVYPMQGDLERLQRLESLLEENRAASAELYVDAPSSIVDEVVRDIRRSPNANKKHLLFGARGGGKSTQLGEIYRRMEDYLRLDLDLDRMGIELVHITAFDLLYVVGLAALKQLSLDKKKRNEELFKALNRAYSGNDPKSGEFEQAVSGLAGFGEVVAKVATTFAKGDTRARVVGAGFGVISAGLRLLLRPDRAALVSANSQEGRGLQVAVQSVFSALRETNERIVVLIDGLERVNGQAAQWFRDTFENTSLLVDAEVTMVLASPPCPFSQTNAASHFGYVIHVLYGYGTKDTDPLTRMLQRRVDHCGLLGDQFGEACRRFAIDSGGHPRWAVMLLKRAVQEAIDDGRGHLVSADLDKAVRRVLETALAIGLTENEYKVMLRVARVGQLPDADVAARLFSDGRILADPPDSTGAPVFRVHPLLKLALDRYREKVTDTLE
jgi:hypothetical protein